MWSWCRCGLGVVWSWCRCGLGVVWSWCRCGLGGGCGLGLGQITHAGLCAQNSGLSSSMVQLSANLIFL